MIATGAGAMPRLRKLGGGVLRVRAVSSADEAKGLYETMVLNN